MDRGAGWAAVYGVAKSQTRLSDFTSLQANFLTLLFHFHQEAFSFLFTFCHKIGVICISEVNDISPRNSIYKWDHKAFSLSLWLISLHTLPSKSFHVVANGMITFFFFFDYYSIACIYHILIHLSIINSAPMNIEVYIFISLFVFF